MTLDRITPASPQPATQPAGNRLDVTLTEPAVPGAVQAPNQETAQVGSIQGVLTPEENRAIAALFESSKGIYDTSGETRPQAVPGLNLDLLA